MIYAILGRKRAGKDSLVKIIQDYDESFLRLAFADPLKQFCSHIYKLPISIFSDDKLKEKKIKDLTISPRDILCEVGQKLKKIHGKNFFINMLLSKIDLEKNYCVSDVRFKNEFKALESFNKIKFIYIDSNKRLNVKSESLDDDISETFVEQIYMENQEKILKIENNSCESVFRLKSIFLLKLERNINKVNEQY